MSKIHKSIVWQLILPVPIALIVGMVGIWLLLPNLVADNVRNDAVQSAQQIANQFKAIRGYYTKNVIKKAVATGAMKPSFNHKDEENAIPLPATFIHDMSAILSEEDTSINLYSEFPFPLRGDRALDSFQQEAWAFLSANPEEVYTQQVTREGREVVRVAIADRMVAEACVKCHNSHPESPKTDWALGDVRGVLEVNTVIDGQLANGTKLSWILILAACLGGALLVVVTVITARAVAQPVSRMTNAMSRLADGDSEIEVPHQERADEIGAMAKTVQIFKDNALERLRLQREQSEAHEKAQHERDTLYRLTGEFEDTIKGVVSRVSESATGMQTTAQSLSAVSEETGKQATVVAAASEEASANVQTVASSAEELASSIREISHQVSKSTEIAGKAAKDAEKTNVEVAGLVEAAQKVGDVVNLISDIAEQTNLLALNATIEAARAGEAGKGFAVVASEVKSLANQTGKATEEISQQISNIQGATTDAAMSIKAIGQTVGEINEIATGIASAVEEQGAATQEIARSVQEASSGTQEVARNISGVTKGASETGAAATQVLTAAEGLSGQSDTLRQEVEKFLNQVRAA